MSHSVDYAWCYCEENVFKLLEAVSSASSFFDRSYAVVMTSFDCPPRDEELNVWTSAVPYRPYKSSQLMEDVTMWDYHVVAVLRSVSTGKWYVVDHDSKLPPVGDAALGWLAPYCIDLDLYVAMVLFLDTSAPAPVSSQLTELLSNVRYRIVEGEDYLSFLRSDRSHMLESPGVFRATPPPWSTIDAPSSSVSCSAAKRAESALQKLPSFLATNNLVCFINISNTLVPGVVVDRHSFRTFFS
ncbi:N-terminal glutamine amidase [Novymonas esmeraldas]|uniref:Protein N-terminal glutamine amidohydrolase n=1 Tax=Novymonas esmeraldas TaxID=1808958 RepID=A0AAW0EZY6_9TRYP